MLEMEWLSELHKTDPTEHLHPTNGYIPGLQSRAAPVQEPECEERSDTTRAGSVNKIDAESDNDDEAIEFSRYDGRDLLAEYWGPTVAITAEALTSLARKHLPAGSASEEDRACWLLSRQHGVCNSVYTVQFQDGEKVCIRVPACGWSKRWSPQDKELLRSTAMAMKMLENKTKVPMPRVIAYDCSFENDIQAPFMLMTCIGGVSAREVWNSDEGPVPKEIRRQNILKGIAQAMSGLRHLKYSTSGSFWFGEDPLDEPVVGESWNLKIKGYVINRRFETAKPYSSTREKLQADLHYLLEDQGFPDNCENSCAKGVFELYRLMVDAFLEATEVPNSDKDFALTHADFNYQNMNVDEAGHLAGILDWDRLFSQPRQTGWSMVPFMLQGDWASRYQWPPAIGADYAPVRPDEFERYRQDYARYMWNACGGVGDCIFTSKSHIYRALFKSTTDEFDARRFVENVLAEILPRSRGLAYCTQLGEYGFRSGEREWLNTRLRAFFKPEPPLAPMSEYRSPRSLTPKILSGVAAEGRRWCHDGIVRPVKDIFQMFIWLLRILIEILSGGLLPLSGNHLRAGTERR